MIMTECLLYVTPDPSYYEEGEGAGGSRGADIIMEDMGRMGSELLRRGGTCGESKGRRHNNRRCGKNGIRAIVRM